MTKAELVKLLENYPDDMIVLARWGRNELNNNKDIRGVEVTYVSQDKVYGHYLEGDCYCKEIEDEYYPPKKVINII